MKLSSSNIKYPKSDQNYLFDLVSVQLLTSNTLLGMSIDKYYTKKNTSI